METASEIQLGGFNASIMLANHVEVAEGSFFISRGGWTNYVIGTPMAVAVAIDIPWNKANQKHRVELILQDSDGHTVMMRQNDGFTPAAITPPPIEVGRPAGLPAGTPLTAMLALNFGPANFNLKEGRRYTWTLFINNQTEEHWHRSFGALRPPMAKAS